MALALARQRRRDVRRPVDSRPLSERRDAPLRKRHPVWLFDLDNTLHDASHAAFEPISAAMTRYIAVHLELADDAATALRQRYWKRYGATLLGLVRHHAIDAAHFLDHTHRLPNLEARLRSSAHDRAALRRLSGRKFVLTNAPRAYALRVLDSLGVAAQFDGVLSIEDMAMFGHLRPKPDARMLRRVAARLKVAALSSCAFACWADLARRASWRSVSLARRASTLPLSRAWRASAASSAASTIAALAAMERSLGNERIG